MPTWRHEFERLSEIEREAIAEWQRNRHASNAVIDAKDAAKAFLIRYQQAGCPPHESEMPDAG